MDKTTWELPENSTIFALSVARAAQNADGVLVVVGTHRQALVQLAKACRFFAPHLPVLSFPDWETLPYDPFSPHPDIVAERLAILTQLPHLTQGILLVPAATLAQRLAPPQFLMGHAFVLAKGDILRIDALRTQLEFCGYQHVSQVLEPGEYAIRGSVFDLYPMGSKHPIRIDLFDNEIDTLRIFDPETQRSASLQDSIKILPAREFPLTTEALQLFRQQWQEKLGGDPHQVTRYHAISARHLPPGIEYYLPLFFTHTATLFDYLNCQSRLVFYGNVTQSLEEFWRELKNRYTQLMHDCERPLLPPEQLFLPVAAVYQQAKNFSQIRVDLTATTKEFASLTINHKLSQPLAALQVFLTAHNQQRILFCCESPGRREAVLSLLKSIQQSPKIYDSWQSFLQDTAKLGVSVAAIAQGAYLDDNALIIIAENQLYTEKIQQRRRKPSGNYDLTDSAVRNLAELKPGDFVVHIEHGIGRYLGLEVLTINQQTEEFLLLEYANNDKLYVPITALHLISRYAGGDNQHTHLQRLGSGQWQKTKRQATEQLRDVAAELLALYAKRAAKVGFACNSPDENYQKFVAEFPFTETPDQELAIEQVIADMTRPQPMDRLICGDVGFGKTEVAMRAAFLAVQNARQVAVLVPTTLLAQQHFNTFTDRFSEWPVRIDVLSRFRTNKEQQSILADIANGKIDIIVGTHKLLAEHVNFHNLGLVIIDEEHRFGVKQKDQMKKLRAEVDILALTATPIPRTLNMALSAIRDLSIIATAPQRRLAIKTFVREHNNHLIREAILRELLRGGQIYYLHNDVATINKVAHDLQALVPESKIEIAHGQMREKQLEFIMAQFYHQKFNVLVCTTIIETGIDIPSANTIIIDRADKLGLAQLHQLRGRVGRSHHQAYAFLFAPDPKHLTAEALKRLEAIASLEELGAGFALASQDLEIRGAGELLGEEQSGNIQALGLSLYLELLEETVTAFKNGKIHDTDALHNRLQQTEIQLHIPAIIPESYLADVQLRLIFYKRIASVHSAEQLAELKVEMIDRCGSLPPSLDNLFQVTELRAQAKTLGISKFELHDKGGKITFQAEPTIEPIKIINLIQKQPQRYKLSNTNTLLVTQDFSGPEEKLTFTRQLLAYFGDKP